MSRYLCPDIYSPLADDNISLKITIESFLLPVVQKCMDQSKPHLLPPPAIYRRWRVPAAVILILAFASGLLATFYLGNFARQEILKESDATISTLAFHLLSEMNDVERAVKAMSGSPWIYPALLSRSERDIKQANAVLKRYNSAFETSVSYVIDKKGGVIASSNYDEADSFVGKNYEFRSYFREAMAGRPGRYFAVGVTSGKRGFYASSAVKDPGGKTIGVAVIKTDLDPIANHLQKFQHCFVASPQGIIFLSSRPGLTLKGLWPIKNEKELLANRQFGDKPFGALFPQKVEDGDEITFDGGSYLFSRKTIIPDGWSIILLSPLHRITLYQAVGISGTLFVCLLISAVIAALYYTERSAAKLRQSRERYRELSVTDDLTGLFNLRLFYQQLHMEMERAIRYHRPLSLILLDIDDFKSYNDQYGHMEGDIVLQTLGQTLKACIRQTEMAFRYGGEEFVVLMPETTAAQGNLIAERIGSTFREHAFTPVAGTSVIKTISLGVTEFRPEEGDKAFITRADRNMYQAKKMGKNRTYTG